MLNGASLTSCDVSKRLYSNRTIVNPDLLHACAIVDMVLDQVTCILLSAPCMLTCVQPTDPTQTLRIDAAIPSTAHLPRCHHVGPAVPVGSVYSHHAGAYDAGHPAVPLVLAERCKGPNIC